MFAFFQADRIIVSKIIDDFDRVQKALIYNEHFTSKRKNLNIDRLPRNLRCHSATQSNQAD